MAELPKLEGWRRDVDGALARCPWPGPRPLTPDDPSTLLCGREEDQQRFRQAVDLNKLVFLHGPSGIGKTSLLLRGLIPELRASGYVVAVCRDWSGTAGSVKAGAFLAERIHSQLVGAVPDLPADKNLFKVLHQELGQHAVLVLDQFEELIRDAPGFKDKLFGILAQINEKFALKVIISLRSEHVHELRTLERKVLPYTYTQFVLEEIEERYAVDVVEAGNRVLAERNDGSPPAITPEAAVQVANRWIAERVTAAKAGTGQSIGLLQLQAFLFALNHLAEGATANEEHVRVLTELLSGRSSNHLGSGLFDQALQYAVDAKLEVCSDAARGIGLDVLLDGGTAITVARTVAHLSSGGFKLVRESGDLLRAAMATEMERLGRGVAMARPAVGAEPDGPMSLEQERAMLDVLLSTILGRGEADGTALDLFAPRRALAEAADRRAPTPPGGVSWVDRLHEGVEPMAADFAEVTSGPMLGMAPAATLIEELRRFVFALEWLRKSDTVRLSSPGDDSVMVALIHDRFGAALERWSRRAGRTNLAPLYGLTAALGADFDWVDWDRNPTGYRPELDGGELDEDGRYLTPPRVLVNLRWRGCRINANLRSVVFVNCDFKGSSFDKCRLEGVTFVNCMLDGLMISDSTIIGRQPELEGDLAADAAPYEVRRSIEAVELIAAYHGVASTSDDGQDRVLVSQPPEFPATIGDASPERRVLEPHNGGVTIYGGRTSSFLVRRCRFEQDGRLALRETAGAGFDVVEHRYESAFEITASRIRHVAFTVSPTSLDEVEPLDLAVDESILAQVWVGAGMVGTARFSNSALIDVWNGAEGFAATVVPDEKGRPSRYHGLVGVALEGDHEPYLEDERVRTLVEIDGPDRAVMGRATGMDYRRHPAEPEVR